MRPQTDAAHLLINSRQASNLAAIQCIHPSTQCHTSIGQSPGCISLNNNLTTPRDLLPIGNAWFISAIACERTSLGQYLHGSSHA